MALTIKHKFTSPKADGPDATRVRPSNWNDTHEILMATASLIGRATAGAGAAEEISLGATLAFSGTALGLSPATAAELAGKAPLASPALTGNPTAPTQPVTQTGTRLANLDWVRNRTPIGSIIMWPHDSNAPPSGWLECNGQSLAVASYGLLFDLIAYAWGGAGANFNLPDFRGEFIRGYDNGRGVDAGRNMYVAQAQDIQPHTHAIGVTTTNLQVGGTSITWPNGSGGGGTTISTGTTETRPRNRAVRFIILAQ